MQTRKKKKVAIFVDGVFIPSVSGAANRFHYLTRTLHQKTDTEMIVFLCDRGWSELSLLKKEVFRIYLIHPVLFKNIDFLEKLLRSENVDILQFSTLELAVQLGIQLAERLNKHLVFEAHYEDYEFAKAIGAPTSILRKITHLQKTFGRYFDKVIALSNEDDSLCKRLNIPLNSLSVVPSGVNASEFSQNCFSIKSKKVVFFGNLYFGINLQALKLVKEVIYPEVKKEGFKFVIIGDIAKKEKTNLEANDFVVTGRKARLEPSFKDSVFALAPVTSGSGIRIKILSYMNAGIPVITTSEGARGFPKKELLVVVDDLKRYAYTMKYLLSRQTLLHRLSIDGRKYIHKNMTWEIVARKVSDQYDKLLFKKIRPKGNAVHKILRMQFEDPPWIKEVIGSKRFARNKPFVDKNRYLVIN